MLYYYAVLYERNTIIPIPFTNREEADDFIFNNHLHAYITIL